MKMTRVLAAALDPITAAGLKSCLAARPELTVVSDRRQTDVDVVVAAFDHLSADAVSMLRSLRGELGKPIVLVIGEIWEEELLTAVECHVVALLPRGAVTDDRLPAGVAAAAAEGDEIPANLLGRLIEHAELVHRRVISDVERGELSLSSREVEVFRLMADGLDTNEIAEKLSYSERTVKNIIYSVTSRFQLRNRTHAVAYVMRAGLI